MIEQAYTDEDVDSLLESDPGETGLPTSDVDWAQRYMRAHRGITRACEHNEELAANEQARISGWLEKINAPLLAKLERLEVALRSFADHEAAISNGKRKKLSTPFGHTQLKAPSPSLVVDDEAAALAYLSQREDWEHYIAVEESVRKAAVKTLMLTDGEVVDGCHIEKPARDTMTITHAEDEEVADDA